MSAVVVSVVGDGGDNTAGSDEPGVDNGELRVGVEDRDIRDVNIVLTFCSASSADESDDADTGDARDDTGEGGCVTSAPRISTGST